MIGDDESVDIRVARAVLRTSSASRRAAYQSRGLTSVKLEENRRSGSKVLDANRIIRIDKPDEYRNARLDGEEPDYGDGGTLAASDQPRPPG